eukprot:TRINITY_DN1173_c0_g1_i7.p1 TRINITY_DN1173_c0_g1~~TRINITY_DN1173_c0_g1_i7.p1  ORF type:complete len:1869 (+),score=315.67 TRINITY_DN1173_c0_g1_i7:176-5782(+)
MCIRDSINAEYGGFGCAAMPRWALLTAALLTATIASSQRTPMAASQWYHSSVASGSSAIFTFTVCDITTPALVFQLDTVFGNADLYISDTTVHSDPGPAAYQHKATNAIANDTLVVGVEGTSVFAIAVYGASVLDSVFAVRVQDQITTLPHDDLVRQASGNADCYKYWRLELKPGMSDISLEIKFRNHSDAFSLYASLTDPRPNSSSHTWMAQTAASTDQVPLVATRSSFADADTLYVSMIRSGSSGPLGYHVRWRSAIPLGIDEISAPFSITRGQTYQWAIRHCSLFEHKIVMNTTSAAPTNESLTPLKSLGCFEQQRPLAAANAVYFDSLPTGRALTNEPAVRFCTQVHRRRYAWLITFEIGYCLDQLPTVPADSCQQGSSPSLAYGGPRGLVVMTVAPLLYPTSLRYYLRSGQDVTNFALPDGYIPGAGAWRPSEHKLETPVTYLTVQYNSDTATFPSNDTDPVSFQLSYSSELQDVCSITPQVGPADASSLITLTGVNFNLSTMCLFRNATASGAVAAPLNNASSLTEATTPGAFSARGQVYPGMAHGNLGWSLPVYITATTLTCPTPGDLAQYLSGEESRLVAVDVAYCAHLDTDGDLACDQILFNTSAKPFANNLTIVSPTHHTFRAYSPGSVGVHGFFPKAHTVNYTTSIDVTGVGFTLGGPSSLVGCSFGGVRSPAVVVNDSFLRCDSPTFREAAIVPLEVTLNNQSYTRNRLLFTYYNPPQAHFLRPALGPVNSSIAVQIHGTGFVDTGSLYRVGFEGLSTTVFATQANASMITFSVPPDLGVIGHFKVRLSMDNRQWLVLAPEFRLYNAPYLTSARPSAVSTLGGTSVTVTGSGFIDSGDQECRFNHTAVPARFVDSTRMVCTAPPSTGPGVSGSIFSGEGHVPVAVSLDRQFFVELPVVAVSAPASDCPDCDQWWAEATAPATYFDSSKVRLTELRPSMGPISGGITVTVTGHNFQFATETAACIFDDAPSVATITQNCTAACTGSVATCTSPPRALAGAVAFNFTRDWTPNSTGYHSASARFVFYKDPEYTAVNPASGPSTGGTVVTVHGRDFLDSAVARVKLVRGSEQADSVRATMALEFKSSTRATFTLLEAGALDQTAQGLLRYRVFVSQNGIDFTDIGLNFTAFPPPTITGMTTLSGTANATTDVALIGTKLPSTVGVTCHVVQIAWPPPNRTLQVPSPNCTAPSCASVASQCSPNVTVVRNPRGDLVEASAALDCALPSNCSCSTAYSPRVIAGTTGSAESRLFGARKLKGSWVSAEEVRCPIPASLDMQSATPAPLRVAVSFDLDYLFTGYSFQERPTQVVDGLAVYLSLSPHTPPTTNYTVQNGYSNSSHTCTLNSLVQACDFTYYPPPYVVLLTPSAGPVSGATTVSVWGSNLSSISPSQAKCQWISPSTQLTAPASYTQRSTPMTFYPAGSSSPVLFTASFDCVTPAWDLPEAVHLELALNGQNFTTDSRVYTFYADPVLQKLQPSAGPVTGGTVVTVSGTSLGQSVTVEASQHAPRCRLANSSWSTDLDGTTVTGEDAFTCTTPMLADVACNATNATNATCFAPYNLKADLNAQQLSSMSLAFMAYHDPEIVDIYPSHGPTEGGTLVYLRTGNALHTGLTTCRFGQQVVSAVDTVRNNASAVACKAPSIELLPHEDRALKSHNTVPVPLQLSFNGQQFGSSTVEYAYVQAPSVSGVTPRLATPFGATMVTVTGDYLRGGESAACRWSNSNWSTPLRSHVEVIDRYAVVCTTPDIERALSERFAVFGDDYTGVYPIPAEFQFSINSHEWSAVYEFSFDLPDPCFTCQLPALPLCTKTEVRENGTSGKLIGYNWTGDSCVGGSAQSAAPSLVGLSIAIWLAVLTHRYV